jgi:hypothetical protein
VLIRPADEGERKRLDARDVSVVDDECEGVRAAPWLNLAHHGDLPPFRVHDRDLVPAQHEGSAAVARIVGNPGPLKVNRQFGHGGRLQGGGGPST